jgi:hypothetical protein
MTNAASGLIVDADGHVLEPLDTHGSLKWGATYENWW